MATKKKAPKTSTVAEKQIEGFADGSYPSFYTNYMGVGSTPFDVSIIFAEVDQRDNGSIGAVPRAKVMMAPEQAANLVVMLTQALKQYVTANGQLRRGGRMELPNEGS